VAVVVLQEYGGRQSAATAQPQTPLMHAVPAALPSVLQSAAVVQPQALLTHAAPARLARQVAQSWPPVPHSAGVFPATQMRSQHPPLHGWLALQVVVHAFDVGSQAWPTGQSAAELQPQACVLATQPWPPLDEVQSTHAAPGGPHADGDVPGWHMPLTQQAPWQGMLGLHAVTHARLPTSHAEPAGQSATAMQPQLPPVAPEMHFAPMLLVVQSTHAPPTAPQADCARPETHVACAQQPPLQPL
jgi:hypothetical protein